MIFIICRCQAVQVMPPKKIPGTPYRDVIYYTSRGFDVPKPMPKPYPVPNYFDFDNTPPGYLPSLETQVAGLVFRHLKEELQEMEIDEPVLDLNIVPLPDEGQRVDAYWNEHNALQETIIHFNAVKWNMGNEDWEDHMDQLYPRCGSRLGRIVPAASLRSVQQWRSNLPK